MKRVGNETPNIDLLYSYVGNTTFGTYHTFPSQSKVSHQAYVPRVYVPSYAFCTDMHAVVPP
eukprot:13513199-Ditylum_brightwellii.AAC.1